MQEKHYSKDGVTVVWKPDVCRHSEKCWRGLPAVFDYNAKPWINMEGAEVARILEQVNNCPSGALSILEEAKDE